MSAYVDPLMNHGWRLGPSCHLFADTIEELRAMAHLVGMKTKWEQPPKQGRPWAHYDLVASRRAEAVKYGAIELDLKQAVAKWREMSNASPREVSRDMASESVKRDANDGGWAFACAAENGHQPGMTLRQWYAGMALQGMYSSGDHWEKAACSAKGGGISATTEQIFAHWAFEAADAMIAAEAGEGPQQGEGR